jgi:hypothetical protein
MAKNNPLKIAQGFPGQMGLLAEQMNRGFGGGLLAQQQYLNDIYDPVVMPQDFFNPEPSKKDTTKKSGGKTGLQPHNPGIDILGVNSRNPVIMVNGQLQPNPNYIRTRTGSDR